MRKNHVIGKSSHYEVRENTGQTLIKRKRILTTTSVSKIEEFIFYKQKKHTNTKFKVNKVIFAGIQGLFSFKKEHGHR